jgi:predicted DNA-binding transcriptional regulator AlpA
MTQLLKLKDVMQRTKMGKDAVRTKLPPIVLGPKTHRWSERKLEEFLEKRQLKK